MNTRTQHLVTCAACALGAIGLGACLDNKVANDAATKQPVFIAQQRDFANYTSWMTFEKDVMDDHGGVVGSTTVYLNQLPPSHASEFPVGTMIVKTMQATGSKASSIHAMVKRGGGFNADGALGWEYFELQLTRDDVPYILWRGDMAPSGEQYQILVGSTSAPAADGDCNSCHAHADADGTFGDLAALLGKHADDSSDGGI